ncbi:MAG TPA: JAB domain-containing protein [Candidatus Saccharimonadales bacterium]|nr:JAB domain-containing protein [Candidatus Saccharimonadales bacterium]
MLLKSRQRRLDTASMLLLLDDIADKRQEHFIVLTYNASMHLINKHLVFLGTVSALICHPREIFAVAIADAASGIVVCHNHPSGDPNPSSEDIKTTQQLVAAGIIIGIPLKDHVIVTKSGGHFSFAENCML